MTRVSQIITRSQGLKLTHELYTCGPITHVGHRCVCIHIHMYVYVRVYEYRYVCVCVHTYMCIQMNVSVYIYTYCVYIIAIHKFPWDKRLLEIQSSECCVC